MDKEKPPHDEFFTYVFSDPLNVRDFLKANIPADVLSLLDLNTLRISKESFVDEELKSHQSDILIETALTSFAEPVCIYILLEHKSSPDRWTLLQLLTYMVKIWKKKRGKRLPVIIPVIFYHGRSQWNYPIEFSRYFDAPESLAPYTPRFTAELFDAGRIELTRVRGNTLYRAAMLLFCYTFRNFEGNLEKIFSPHF